MSKGRYSAFLVGLGAGAVVVANWKVLVRSAVKAGVVSTSELKTATARYAEDLSDLVAEARFEAGLRARTLAQR